MIQRYFHMFWGWLVFSAQHKTLLQAMVQGNTLKSHRYLDGCKVYRLHPLVGQYQEVQPSLVRFLYQRGLIDSNKKFPSATYWLTQKGIQWAASQNTTIKA